MISARCDGVGRASDYVSQQVWNLLCVCESGRFQLRTDDPKARSLALSHVHDSDSELMVVRDVTSFWCEELQRKLLSQNKVRNQLKRVHLDWIEHTFNNSRLHSSSINYLLKSRWGIPSWWNHDTMWQCHCNTPSRCHWCNVRLPDVRHKASMTANLHTHAASEPPTHRLWQDSHTLG